MDRPVVPPLTYHDRETSVEQVIRLRRLCAQLPGEIHKAFAREIELEEYQLHRTDVFALGLGYAPQG